MKSDLEIETEAYQENEVIKLRGLKKHVLNEVRFLLDLEGSCRKRGTRSTLTKLVRFAKLRAKFMACFILQNDPT